MWVVTVMIDRVLSARALERFCYFVTSVISIFTVMNFNISVFEPFPVFHPSRPETPPLDFDTVHPFTGIELVVSGLPRDSLSAAQNHLQRILQDLGRRYTNFPAIYVVSPATTDPLGYVWVSLADPLKEVPCPDILDSHS